MVTCDEISPREASRRLAEFCAIDVRAEHEFRGPLGRVRGSRLLPLPDLEARADELPKERPLLLVCRSGNRSGKACEKLTELGIGPVVNLAGGMIEWNRAELPVEHADPASLVELLELVTAWFAQVSPCSLDEARSMTRERLEKLGSSCDQPTHAAVDLLLGIVEESLTSTGAPPDLALSITSFRRWLAVL